MESEIYFYFVGWRVFSSLYFRKLQWSRSFLQQICLKRILGPILVCVLMIHINVLCRRNKDIKRCNVLETRDQVSKVKCINLTMENYNEKPELFTMGKK